MGFGIEIKDIEITVDNTVDVSLRCRNMSTHGVTYQYTSSLNSGFIISLNSGFKINLFVASCVVFEKAGKVSTHRDKWCICQQKKCPHLETLTV